MRFHSGGPAIPDQLLQHCDDGRVVFLCGAGFSNPAGLPDFKELTSQVIDSFNPSQDSNIRKDFENNLPLDQVFHFLYQEFVKEEVDEVVAERLRTAPSMLTCSNHHDWIKRISSSQAGHPQVVTTNFDVLFELNEDGNGPKIHIPPALPDLSLGSGIEGITYLHGRLADIDAESHGYVLSSADFGRAYLSEGWATKFVRNLLRHYTVVLLGYRAEDPPVKYLLQGLSRDSQHDRSRLYAFSRGRAEDVEAEWRDRGVTAIAYSEHDDLWQTLKSWAERKDHPRQWLESVIASANKDPKSLEPYERGQVVHALRTTRGAKLFASANPPAHPEWICVFDSRVRSAEPSKSYTEDNEVFFPSDAYGLDDDKETLSIEGQRKIIADDSVLVWRNGDDNPTEGHSLSPMQAAGFEIIPVRLGYLVDWIVNSIQSPVIAWWIARQSGLHPRLLQQLTLNFQRVNDLPPRATHIWNLLLEHQKHVQSFFHDFDWYLLKDRVLKEGWSPSVLRFFREVATPRIEISLPLGIAKSKPPALTWDNVKIYDIGNFEVKFLERYKETLDVPDDVITQVFRVIEDQFLLASGLLKDIENPYFSSPTLYPGREMDGRPLGEKMSEAVLFFVHLFDLLSEKQPKIAESVASQWSESDAFFFRKFKLYALSKEQVFEASTAAETLLSFSQEAFWDRSVSRELLFLLVDRWSEFSMDHRHRLIDRILVGPDREAHWTEEVYAKRRSELAARYGRYLELNGCSVSDDQHNHLNSIIKKIPRWNDLWVQGAVSLSCSRTYSVHVDESPGSLLNAPVDQVIEQVMEELRSDDRSVEYRPFVGLIKNRPLKALRSLVLESKKNNYPAHLWKDLIAHFPVNASVTLKLSLVNRLISLPDNVVVELRYSLGNWIKGNLNSILEIDETLGWKLFDRIVGYFLGAGEEATESSLGEARRGGKALVESRRTYHYAINSPIGNCANALINSVPEDIKPALPKGVKSRIEQLMTAPGEGADHATSIFMMQLNWLMHVDPLWASESLIPILSFEHSLAEPAWDGFIRAGQRPTDQVLTEIRPLLNDFVPWMNTLYWEDDMYKYAIQWLAQMYMFLPEADPNQLSAPEMRSILRYSTADARNEFILWLGQVAQVDENGWNLYVIPFVKNVWPLESKYRTSASVKAWINLLDDTGESFPEVYETIKKFLNPVAYSDFWLYRFTHDLKDEECLTKRFPELVLDMMDRVTGTQISPELKAIIEIVIESAPELETDRRYQRLFELVEMN